MLSFEHFILIVGMAAVTYFSRVTPILLLSGRRLNPFIERWLQCVPPAVLMAMLLPDLIMSKGEAGGQLFISWQNPFILAAIPSIIVARLSGGFFAPVAVGMGSLALLRYLSSQNILFSGIF